MSTDSAGHRELAVGYFNATWQLVDQGQRTADEELDMLTTAFASRQHWQEAGGTDENRCVADWQVAHVASRCGFGDLSMRFATAALDRAEAASLPTWLLASCHEGMARAHATLGDGAGCRREVALTQRLLAQVDDQGDRALIAGQLAGIPIPE